MCARVLIVDDEKRLAKTLGQTLQLYFSDCQVDTASSGEEALGSLGSNAYDLIIADVHMPGVSGMDLIKDLRMLDAQIPIILMTGYGSASLREEAANLGVDHCIDKPFGVNDLISKVGALLPGGEVQDA